MAWELPRLARSGAYWAVIAPRLGVPVQRAVIIYGVVERPSHASVQNSSLPENVSNVPGLSKRPFPSVGYQSSEEMESTRKGGSYQ